MTKERKGILIFTIIFFMLIFFPTIVNATDVTYKTEFYSSIDTAIYVNGLDNNLEEGYNYYIYITQDNTTDVDTVISEVNVAHCDSLKYDAEKNQFYLKVSAHNMGIFEKAGDYYAFIVKGKITHKDTFSLMDGPTKLERPQLLANGKRITAYFNKDGAVYYISQYAYHTKMYRTDRKVKFYLGKIEDENILKKLSENTSDAYDILYDYAKKNADYLYSGAFDTTATGTLDYNIWKDYTGLKNGEYYFVYYKLDDENGKYAEMDDVQAYTFNNSGVLEKFSKYVVNDDKEQSPGTTDTKPTGDSSNKNQNNNNSGASNNGSSNNTIGKKDDKTIVSGNLPKTGVSLGLILAMTLVIAGGIFTYFKYNRLKDI